MTLLAALIIATAAPAQPEASESRWYGWQTLLTDLAAVGFGLALADPDVSESTGHVLATGMTVAWFAAPAIHYAHGRDDLTVAMSVVLRITAPLLGAAVGAASTSDPNRI